MSTEGIPAKPRRRSAAKASGPQDVQRVKLTLYLPAELAKRFGVHAEMMDQDKSELFAEMVRAHCRRFVVHDHAREAANDLDEAGAA
jgi:phytoene/squalene synthetase